MNNTLKSTFILTLTAMIWGFAFVAQRSSMEYVGPFFFSGVRSLLGGLTLVIVLFIQNRISSSKGRLTGSGELGAEKINLTVNNRPYPPSGEEAGSVVNKKSPSLDTETKPQNRATSGLLTSERKELLLGGITCGFILFAGSNFQQVGLVFTTASKAGFITALYIVLVPIFGIILKHKTHWNTWVGVLMAAVGLYFLCITESLDIKPGDLIVLFGAAFWAMHILVIAHFVSRIDAVKLSCVQFFVCGILSLIVMPFADFRFNIEFTMQGLITILPSILYTGILSSGAGFTLQAIGQKYANPTAASIIMSTEAVFGVIGGFMLLGESFSGREMFGCILMFAAVILAQLPMGSKK
jgi:drug/metabolite transporter (DMT)-like permease